MGWWCWDDLSCQTAGLFPHIYSLASLSLHWRGRDPRRAWWGSLSARDRAELSSLKTLTIDRDLQCRGRWWGPQTSPGHHPGLPATPQGLPRPRSSRSGHSSHTATLVPPSFPEKNSPRHRSRVNRKARSRGVPLMAGPVAAGHPALELRMSDCPGRQSA